MSKRIGKFVTVSIDDSGGTARAVTNDITSVGGIETTYDEGEVGGYSQDKFYLALRADAPLTIEGLFNPTATTGSHTVLNSIVGVNTSTFTVTIAIGDNAAPTTGDPEWEGEYRCMSYTPTFDLNAPATFTATLMPASSTLPAWGTVA
jgi:hypothetical protein